MSTAPVADDAKTKARETAKSNPLENATTLRGIYENSKGENTDKYRFPGWVLEPDRWDEGGGEKSHKFDETIVVYDDDASLNEVKELVEEREPVNMEMKRRYNENNLEQNFGWKKGAYEKSTTSKLYPNIGIYCHARVTNGIEPSKPGAEEKNVHVMNLIGYAFDKVQQPDYQYFLKTYGDGGGEIQSLTDTNKDKLKHELIQRYRKIWLKACYICKFKRLTNLWYYGVGSGWFSDLLPKEYNMTSGNFYRDIFAPAFGIEPGGVSESQKKSNDIDPSDIDIPINFCIKYGIKVLNLGPSPNKYIPDVLFTLETTPADTLYINAWDPWSIIGNGNAGDDSLDGHWGRNSNMSVLGWSMTNSKLLPDIVGGGGTKPSKILKMSDILAQIEAEGGGKGAGKALVSGGDQTPPPSTPPPSATQNCNINTTTKTITGITTECQDAIFSLVAEPVISSSSSDEPTEMSNLVSAIGTDYSSSYATEKIMPAGSATLLYIGDNDLYSIKQVVVIDAHGNKTTIWDPDSKTTTKIKYMIHASPAKSDNVKRDITKDTISNSVMNSLILAAKNGVKKIIFPFIGGQIFYDTLKANVDAERGSSGKKYDKAEHAEVLVKGVTDFYDVYNKISFHDTTPLSIDKIYFLTYGKGSEEESGMQEAIRKATDGTSHLGQVLKQLKKGTLISNVITPHGVDNIDAIVNAGNTNHGFASGSGVADMCFAGLNDNNSYQTKLDTIKTKFIEAFNAYIANTTSASSPPPSSPEAKPVEKKPFADVLTGLEGRLTQDSENDAEIKKLVTTLPTDFLYPTDGEEAAKKNLNSAEPDIDTMIKGFETAVDGDDTKFYLGACGSIKAAYDLDMSLAGSDDNKKMRAKLLLNLRKNSLLLKVPARWDYKEMKLGVEVVPELTRKPIIRKDIIPMELTETDKDTIIQKLVENFELFKTKSESRDSIDIDSNDELNKIYDNGYITLLNDISYLNFNVRPSTSSTSNSLIFQLLAYISSNYIANLLEYFTSKKAIENIDEYLKTNISNIVKKINKKIIDTGDDNTKIIYSDFYKFLLETKRIDILEYILSEHDYASRFSGVIRPYYEQILEKEKTSIDDILQSVGYIFKSGYGDGNCFYNSAGMQLIKPPVSYKQYNLLDRFSQEWWKPQNEKQSELRNKLAEFLSKIYNKVKDLNEFKESQLEFIKYLQKYGKTKFDNVSTIDTPISGYYWGTDDELFYISLLYNCFVVILSPNSQEFQTIEYKTLLTIDSSDHANTFKIISDPTRNNYDADGLKLALSSNTKPVVFMVGGGGHWDYAIPLSLNQSGGSNNIPRPITYTDAANTTHATSKSRRNSSFKASSSKTKGKSRNRSHTQRVK
jgi:hypothetical protein